MTDFDPPAIVAQSRQEIEATVANIFVEINREEKRNLAQFIEAGKMLIRLKEMTDHGDWEATLKRMGISSQTCSNAMRLAKSPSMGISKCHSIDEALRLISTEPTLPDSYFKAFDNNSKLCRPCRIGKPKPNCKDCAALNNLGGQNEPSEPPKPPRWTHTTSDKAGREPGDETEPGGEKDTARVPSGTEKFNLRKFNEHLATAFKMLRGLALEHGLRNKDGTVKEEGDLKEMRKHLAWVSDKAKKWQKELVNAH